jgi:transposase
MRESAQKRAVRSYRQRLSHQGLTRFEVLGFKEDRELIRSLAKRLARNDAEAARLRSELRRSLAGAPPKTGTILAALRQSPLVGADLNVTREITPGRDVDL